MFILVLIFVGAYLLGSIPTAVWLGKALKGTDLREHGSGNAGATNAFRVLGKAIGTVVLLLDMLKGYAAVSLAHGQSLWLLDSEEAMILKIVLQKFANIPDAKCLASPPEYECLYSGELENG